MATKYYSIMEKHLNESDSNLNEIAINDRIKAIDCLAKIGLSESILFSKALIENYFLDDEKSKPILDLINKTLEEEKNKTWK